MANKGTVIEIENNKVTVAIEELGIQHRYDLSSTISEIKVGDIVIVVFYGDYSKGAVIGVVV